MERSVIVSQKTVEVKEDQCKETENKSRNPESDSLVIMSESFSYEKQNCKKSCNKIDQKNRNKTDDDKLHADIISKKLITNDSKTQKQSENVYDQDISPRSKLPDLIPDLSAESYSTAMNRNNKSDRERSDKPPPLPESDPPIMYMPDSPPPLPLSEPPSLIVGINNTDQELISEVIVSFSEQEENDPVIISPNSEDNEFDNAQNERPGEQDCLLSDYDSDSTMENETGCESSYNVTDEKDCYQNEIEFQNSNFSLDTVEVPDISDISSAEDTFNTILLEFKNKDKNDATMDFDEEFEAIFNSLGNSNSDLDSHYNRFAGRRDKYGFILSPIIESPSPTPSSMSGYSGLSSVSPDPFSMFRVSPAPRASKRELDLSSLGKAVSEWEVKEEQTIPIYRNRPKGEIFIPDAAGWESDNELLTPTSSSEWDSFPSGLSTPPINVDVQFGGQLRNLNRPDNIIYEENESSSAGGDSDDSEDTVEAYDPNSDDESANISLKFTDNRSQIENNPSATNVQIHCEFNDSSRSEYGRAEQTEGNGPAIEISNFERKNDSFEINQNIQNVCETTIKNPNNSPANTNLSHDPTHELKVEQNEDTHFKSQLSEYIRRCDVVEPDQCSETHSVEETLRRKLIELSCSNGRSEDSNSDFDSDDIDSDDDYCEEFENEILSNESSDEVTANTNYQQDKLSDQNVNCTYLKECLNSTAYIFVPTTSVIVSGTMTPDDVNSISSSDENSGSPNMSSFGSGVMVTQYTSEGSDSSDTDTKVKYQDDQRIEGVTQTDRNEDTEDIEQQQQSHGAGFHSPLSFSFLDANVQSQMNEESPRSPRVLGRHYLEMNESERALCISPPTVAKQQSSDFLENNDVNTNKNQQNHNIKTNSTNLLKTEDNVEDFDNAFKTVHFKAISSKEIMSKQTKENIAEQSDSEDNGNNDNELDNYSKTIFPEIQKSQTKVSNNGQYHFDFTEATTTLQKNFLRDGEAQKGTSLRKRSPIKIKIANLKRKMSSRNKIKPGYVKTIAQIFTETCKTESDTSKIDIVEEQLSFDSETEDLHSDTLFVRDDLNITGEMTIMDENIKNGSEIQFTPLLKSDEDTDLHCRYYDKLNKQVNAESFDTDVDAEDDGEIQVSNFCRIEPSADYERQLLNVSLESEHIKDLQEVSTTKLKLSDTKSFAMKEEHFIAFDEELAQEQYKDPSRDILVHCPSHETYEKKSFRDSEPTGFSVNPEYSDMRSENNVHGEVESASSLKSCQIVDEIYNPQLTTEACKLRSNEILNTEAVTSFSYDVNVESEKQSPFDKAKLNSCCEGHKAVGNKAILETERPLDSKSTQSNENITPDVNSCHENISKGNATNILYKTKIGSADDFEKRKQEVSEQRFTFQSENKCENNSSTCISEKESLTQLNCKTNMVSFPDNTYINQEHWPNFDKATGESQDNCGIKTDENVFDDRKSYEQVQIGKKHSIINDNKQFLFSAEFLKDKNDADFCRSIEIQINKFKTATPSFFFRGRKGISDSKLEIENISKHKHISDSYDSLMCGNAEARNVHNTVNSKTRAANCSSQDDMHLFEHQSNDGLIHNCGDTESFKNNFLNFEPDIFEEELCDNGQASFHSFLPEFSSNTFQHTLYDAQLPMNVKSKLLKKPAGQSDYCIQPKRNTVTVNNSIANRSNNILPVVKCSDASCDKCIFDFPRPACHSSFIQVNSGCCNINSENINVISHQAKGGERLSSELTNDCFRENEGGYIQRRVTTSENTHQTLAMNDGAAKSVNSRYDTRSPLTGINGCHLRETQNVFHSRMPRSDTRSSKPGSFLSKDTSVGLQSPDNTVLAKSSVYDRVIEDECGRIKGWPYSDLDNQDKVPVKVYRTFKKLSLEDKTSPRQSTTMRIFQTEERSAEMPDDRMVQKVHSSSVLPSDTSETQLMKSHAESVQAALQTDANGNTVNEEDLAGVIPKLAETVANMKNVNAEEILPGITQTVAKLKDGGNLVITTMTRKVVEDEDESSSNQELPAHPVLDVDDLENSKIYLVQDSKGDLFYVEDVTSESQESAYFSSSRHTSESVSDSGNSPTFQRISKIKQVGDSGINESTAEELISAMYDQNGITEIDEFEDEYSERTYEYSLPRGSGIQESVPKRDYSKDTFRTSYMVEEPDSSLPSHTVTAQGGKTTTKDHYESSYQMTSAQPWVFDGIQQGQYGSQTNYSQAVQGYTEELENASTLSETEGPIRMQNVIKTAEATGSGYTTTTEKYSVEAEAYVIPPSQPEMTLCAVPPAVYVPPPVPIAAGIQTDDQANFSLVKVDMTPKSVVPKEEMSFEEKEEEEEKERPIYKTVAHIQTKERPRPQPMGVDIKESKKYKIITTKPTPDEEVQESHMSLDEVDYKLTTENVEYKLTTPAYESQQFYVRSAARSASPERFRSEKRLNLNQGRKEAHKTEIQVKDTKDYDTQTYEENSYSYDKMVQNMENTDGNMRVVRGSYLIKNTLDEADGALDDNLNMFDGSFTLRKDNPLYQSDEDIYKRFEREKAENARKQERFQKDLNQDITFETVDKFSKTKTVKREEKPKQSLQELLMSRLSTIDAKDIRHHIDVKHHSEDIYGDPQFLHADGTQVKDPITNNFDTVGEKVDLVIKDGKAYITVTVTAERITPVDLEFNVWRKNQAIITRVIEVNLLVTEERRRVYRQVMEEPGTRSSFRTGSNETVLDGQKTLEVFTRILGAAEGEGDKEDITVKTRHGKTTRPFSSGMDLLY